MRLIRPVGVAVLKIESICVKSKLREKGDWQFLFFSSNRVKSDSVITCLMDGDLNKDNGLYW